MATFLSGGRTLLTRKSSSSWRLLRESDFPSSLRFSGELSTSPIHCTANSANLNLESRQDGQRVLILNFCEIGGAEYTTILQPLNLLRNSQVGDIRSEQNL
jgi:hypothetical protein